MNELAKLAIDAHGGLDRWNRFTTVSAQAINGGVLWAAKGKAGVLHDVTVTVDLRNAKASHWPFGSLDRRSRFEPQRVTLEDANGKVLEELLQPRSSFQGSPASFFRRRGRSSLANRTAIPRPNRWSSPSTWIRLSSSKGSNDPT